MIAKFAPQKLARIIFNAAKPLFERLLLLELFIGRFRRSVLLAVRLRAFLFFGWLILLLLLLLILIAFLALLILLLRVFLLL